MSVLIESPASPRERPSSWHGAHVEMGQRIYVVDGISPRPKRGQPTLLLCTTFAGGHTCLWSPKKRRCLRGGCFYVVVLVTERGRRARNFTPLPFAGLLEHEIVIPGPQDRHGVMAPSCTLAAKTHVVGELFASGTSSVCGWFAPPVRALR